MNSDSKIPFSTFIVECGRNKGTCFCIGDNLFLTAFHVIGACLNGCDINIIIGNIYVQCSLKRYEKHYDFAILECKECKKQIVALDLLAMPIESSTHYYCWGHPASQIGQEIGQELCLHTNSVYNVLSCSDFDSYASIVDSDFVVYNGFSGSPVFVADDKIVGIVSHKLDGSIGFISIKSIAEFLRSDGISVADDYVNYQLKAYGFRENRAFIEKQISLTGKRYRPNLNVDNVYFDNFFRQLWDVDGYNRKIKKAQGYQKQIDSILTQEMINVTNYCVGSDLFSDNYQDCHWLLNFLTQDSVNSRKVLNRLKQIPDTKEIFLDAIKAQEDFNKRIWYVCGRAGVGKTHNICRMAQKYLSDTRIYLCFGSQFYTNDSPINQFKRIFHFSSDSFLDDLNRQANTEGVRYIFIIDAINEGLDDYYWSSYLLALSNEFKNKASLCLLLTIRSPFDDKIGISHHNAFSRFNLTHLSNVSEIKEKYFKEYGITYSRNLLGFSNGLFLNIFCETFLCLNEYQKSYIDSIAFLYWNYACSHNSDISNKVDEDPYRQIVPNYLLQLAKLSLDKNFKNITRNEAKSIDQLMIPGRTWSHSLLFHLLNANLLLADWAENDDTKDVVLFEYEQMEDVFRAMAFVYDVGKKQMSPTDIIDTIADQKSHSVDAARFYNYLEILTAIWPESFQGEEMINLSNFCSESVFIKAFLSGQKYRKNKLNEDAWLSLWKNQKMVLDYSFMIENFHMLPWCFFKKMHESLSQLSQHDLDLQWTYVVNRQYEEGDLNSIFDSFWIESDNHDFTKDSKWWKVYACLLTWVCASSFPIVRALAKRRLYEVILKQRSLADNLLSLFSKVKDAYVLEGLYCVLYGVSLTFRNKKFSNELSASIYNLQFKNKSPFQDAQIREWMLKILLFDKLKYDGAFYDLSLPPYSSAQPSFPEELSVPDDFFGDSPGSKQIQHSLCSWDFARYIIGTNSNFESDTFSLIPINDTTKHKNPTMIVLDAQIKIMAEYILKMGWNDNLGEKDKTVTSGHNNTIERIGKKYQWIAINHFTALMMDNFKMIDSTSRFGQNGVEIYPVNYPWLSPYRSHFDVTMSSPDYSNITKTENFILDRLLEGQDEEWFDNLLSNKQLENFFAGKGHKWVLLHNIFSTNVNDDLKKDFFISYETILVKKENTSSFEKWATEQSFVGRWMPIVSSQSECMLLEYPWSPMVKDDCTIDYSYGNQVCPCSYYQTICDFLQENTMGFNDNLVSSYYLPVPSIMKYLNLYIKDYRGVSYDSKGKIAFFCNLSDKNYPEGSFLRSDLLNKYLHDKNLSMYYIIVSEKSIVDPFVKYKAPGLVKQCSACAKYSEDGSISWVKDVEYEK